MALSKGKRFHDAVTDLKNCGFMEDVHKLDHCVYVAQDTQGWAAIAVELAERLGGVFFPSRGGGGLTWICGRDGPHGILVPWQELMKITDAKEAAYDLGLGTVEKPVWSVGAVARFLLDFVDSEPPDYEPTTERLLQGVEYGFHCCKSGIYKKSNTPYIANDKPEHILDESHRYFNDEYDPAVTLFDVKSYYYNILRRSETLNLSVFPGMENPLKFWPMKPGARSRYREVIDLIDGNKPLRNTFAGVLAGTDKPMIGYTSSESTKQNREMVTDKVRRIYIKRKFGAHRAIGLLLVRTGYELCQLEALTSNAIYGTIDSVATVNIKPSVWPSFGFNAELKASGNAHICHRGSYKIGQRQTLNFRDGRRVYTDVSIRELPPVNYTKHWL